MKINTEPVRGTNDYLPNEMRTREYVRKVILENYQKYGFTQVVTPVLEDITTLLGSDGGDNLKLIFKVLKRGEKLDLSQPNLKEKDIIDYGLRYDLTVPLVRMYSNNQAKLPLPFKSIQIGDSFRADRPQRGRLRQFIQCDIDILGDPSSNAEIDLLNTTSKTYQKLGFKNFTLKINDRRLLFDILNFVGFDANEHNEICVCLDKIDKIGLSGIEAELNEKGFDSFKSQRLVSILSVIVENGLDSVSQFGVRKEVKENLSYIISSLKSLSNNLFEIKFDISVVRGQGYYTGTVYEFYMPNFSGACGGGGRYDTMIEKMTGKALPAVGVSIGFEPTCMLISEGHLIKTESNITAVIYKPEDNFIEVLKVVEEQSKSGEASAIPMRKNLNFQLENLKQNGFTKYVIFGKDEVRVLQ